MVKAAVTSSLQAANGQIPKTLDVLRQQVSGHVQVVDQQIMSAIRPQFDQLARIFQMQQDALTKRVSGSERTLGEHETDHRYAKRNISDIRKQVELDKAAPAKTF
eukprot:1200890-Pyramimonas_sp.AAC.1